MDSVKRIILFLVLVTVSVFLSAQQGEKAGTIIYAEGEIFTISRGDKFIEYDLYYDTVIGITLEEGDYVSTERGTFLEIQLTGSPNVLKISENTSFSITESERRKGNTFSIAYGRLRAKVGKLVGNEEFVIRSHSVVAGVRGTDFGYDVIVGQGEGSSGTSTTKVYCFEGEVEVKKIERVTPTEPEKEEEELVVETVVLKSDQMITQTTDEPEKPLEVAPIEEDVTDFWKQNDFEGQRIEPVVAESEEEAESEEPSVAEVPAEKETDMAGEEADEEEDDKAEPEEKEEPVEHKIFNRRDTLVKVGTGSLVGGLLFEGIGIGLYLAGDAIFPRAEPTVTRKAGVGCMIAGGVFLSGALVAYITALLE